MKKITVIGNTRFVIDCLEIMNHCADADVKLVISDPKLQTLGGLVGRYCEQHNLPHLETDKVNSDETLTAVENAKPDVMFSAFNMRILKDQLLSIPKQGTVNYHNGPLPKYRGVNIYSWAILNGEKQHGVTWHWVDEGIDTGDIIGQKTFPLDDRETPFTMARKCFRAGVDLLGDILEPLLAGQVQAKPQDHTVATYYAYKDTPNDGWIDLTWSFARLERFTRALDFRPMENTLAHPTLRYQNEVFHPQKVTRVSDLSSDQKPGQIICIEDDQLDIAIGDGVVGFTEFLDYNKQSIDVGALVDRTGMQVGDCLVK